MPNPLATAPFELPRNLVTSGRWLTYKKAMYDQGSSTTAGDMPTYNNIYVWSALNGNREITPSAHGAWNSLTSAYDWSYSYTYHGIAYSYDGSSWSLEEQNNYVVTGSPNTNHIVTHGYSNSTISFNSSAGALELTNGDSVYVNAPNDLVTITGGSGTINTSANAADKFYVNTTYGITVNAGDSDDSIVVHSYNNHINADTNNDTVTIDSGYTGNTIHGGAGLDYISQIDGNNEIHGDGDHDVIHMQDSNTYYVDGGAGSDDITLRSHNSRVYGGADNDNIIGSNINTIHGGGEGGTDTSDTIQANDGNLIYGDAGADSITVHNANIVYGGTTKHDGGTYDGIDKILANNSNTIYGGDGDDSVTATDSNHIEGNDGSDKVLAEDHNSVLGGGGHDSIWVSEYNLVYGGTSLGIASDINDSNDGGIDQTEADAEDTIFADIGNTVFAGGGNDTIAINYRNKAFGGAGNDTIEAKDDDSISGGIGADCIIAGQHSYIDAGQDADNVKAGFNSSVWGFSGNDTITATDDTSWVDGGSGNDTVFVQDDSTVYGGAGKDCIEASSGNIIYGDADATSSVVVDNLLHGNDMNYTGALLGLHHSDSADADDDSIKADSRNTIHGGWGKDNIIGIDSNLTYGDVGNDTIFFESHNSIWGGAGSDVIRATDFNLIYGDDSRGDDSGAGDDSIVARTDDTIYGGAGKDTIIADDAAKIDAGSGDDSISFGMNSSIVAGTGNDTIVSQAPGSPTAPNGSNGSTIWGGKGKVDKFGHPIHYETSGGVGTDTVTGAALTAKSPGVHDVHGHNIFTGADALVTIMDFKFGNDVIHFGTAFEASAVTAFGYGNSTIVPTTDYQIYTAGTDRINVAATISDAANIDMRDEAGKFVMFGNPNGTLKGGFANTLLGGKNDDTIYVGEGDYVYGGVGNDTINLNGYNNWRDHVGLTAEGGTDTISCFQQGWGEGDDVVWYNVPLRKQAVDTDGNLLFDSSHKPIYTGTDINTDAVADLNDANVRVVGDKIVLSQGKAKLILNGVTHGEILIEDGEGVHRTALLGDGYFNDSTRGGQIFIGRKEYSDIVSFEKNNHDLVVDLGMTKRFKDKSAKFYSIEQAIGGSGNNTLVGAKNVRNTLEGGVGTSSIWGGGISADLMVSGTGSATDHYTTFFYGTGDGDDTIEGFRTTERTEAHFKRDILDIHSGDVTSVRKVGTSIVLNMSGRTDRLTIRNAASGLFDQLIEVNVMGKKGAAKVTGANEVVTYDPHAQYYFSNAKAGGTVRNFGDNSRIYLDGRTGDVYKGITNIDVSAGSRLELAGDASNNRIIYRGTGTASLYGGLGNDTMTGSKDGTNRFFFGRSDGNDVITNSTVNDKVMLYDVALEEVVSAKETNGTMRIALKSGARLAIQNFDAKSVHDFTLATGDTWVYNHNATGTGGYWSPKGNYPVQPKA